MTDERAQIDRTADRTADGPKKLPYGLTDYELIRRENYYYVDKTRYLNALREAGRYLFFIRPRRFGKSLFLSVMKAYYDILYKDRFKELFGGTAVYDEPSGERCSHLVLNFNFSLVNPALDRVEVSFLNHVQATALAFIGKYAALLDPRRDYYRKKIEESATASDILFLLMQLCRESNRKSYVIVDEYDNFSNTILSTVGGAAYHDLTRGEGFFRSFFNVLKGGTDGMEAPFTRLILTGVSPITLDDVTSGFNIGKNVSMEPRFNPMLGFTRDEVLEMIDYYNQQGQIYHPAEELLEIMTRWYGNYRFSEDDDARLFNPDMVLYFLDNYMSRKKLPTDLVDRNVRIDYGKLRHLIIIDGGKTRGKSTNGNFSKLKEIIEQGGTSANLEKAFPLEKLTAPSNFKSLLFYFGLLTIQCPEKDRLRLVIPNETVKRLYYDYITEAYRETDVFDLDLSRYADLMTGMAYDGKWRPLFEFITDRMRESMSLRDLITGEKSIQAFLNVYLGLSNLYIVHPEKELNKGYADIVMEPFLARYEDIRYAYLLEIKYIKATEKPDKKELKRLQALAVKQLAKYSLDEKLRGTTAKTTLVRLVLVFHGPELLHIGEAEAA